MRRAVLMTRQAISPRLAIRMRLNMLFLSLDLGRDPSLAVWADGTGRVAPVVHQNGQEATVKSAPPGVPDGPKPAPCETREPSTAPWPSTRTWIWTRTRTWTRPWPRHGPGRE